MIRFQGSPISGGRRRTPKNKFTIASSGSDTWKLPPDIADDHFTHVKELELKDISSIRAPRAFSHVTKLTWHVGPRSDHPVHLPGLLATLEQLPVLEQVDLFFRTSQDTAINPSPQVVTLPHVQRMSLRCSERWRMGVPRILQFLELPNLTSLVVDTEPESASPFPVLPVTSFGKHLPNLAELTEVEVYADYKIGRVRFRSPSRAVLECRALPQLLVVIV
jgi:hypothetical protein